VLVWLSGGDARLPDQHHHSPSVIWVREFRRAGGKVV
jgi:hypothetical protein